VIYLGGSFQSIQGKGVYNFAALSKDMYKPNYNFLKGTVYEDSNGNCVKDASEKGIANMVVVAKPGNFYGFTDSLGNYTLAVDIGKYTIEQIISENKSAFIKQNCLLSPYSHSVHFTGSNDSIVGLDFANQTVFMPQLSVNVSSDRRRRCFTNTTTVSYCNTGTADAADAKVYVQLPEYVVLKSANAVFTKNTDNNYVFSIGTLSANVCGKIVIQDSVVCSNSSIRGLTQCTKVWITPANSRTPSGNWDQSDITLKAKCQENGRVKIGLYNSGIGNMADSSTFRIYFDAQLVFKSTYKLAKGDSLILQVPANGQTLRLEADQQSFHPSRIQSHITIEACGTNRHGTVSKGFVNQQTQEEEEPEIATECLPIIDSYDPNDKLVLPQGVTASHFTPTNKALHYTIRFQNTGSDYAYKVVLVDTLSQHLDMSTFQMGAASHSYKLSVSGKGQPVLTFTFDNINLPDSTRDQQGSNGFIKFSIKPMASIAEKSIIENNADIFFDFNEPIRTNTVFNAIYDVPVTTVNNEKIIICQTNAIAFAGSNRFLCGQDTVYLQASAPAAGNGKWKLIKGAANIQNLTKPTSLVTNLAYGENIFEWKVSVNSCFTDSSASTVTLHRKPDPAIPAIIQKGTDSLFCNISSATYDWYWNGAKLEVTAQQIQVSESGNYTVKVSLDGCSSPLSEIFIYDKMPTGLSEYASQINVYPNPTTKAVFIDFPVDCQAKIILADAIGRILKSNIHTNQEQRSEISLTGVRAGIYFLYIETEKGTIVKKLIVR
jgi:hypothetical protein